MYSEPDAEQSCHLLYWLRQERNTMATPETKSCGFLLVRKDPVRSFLPTRHPARWDLPKGHLLLDGYKLA